MKYPVLLCLCLVFFAAYGIPVNDQNEEHGISADKQNEISCDIQNDDQNKERDNQIEEPNVIQDDRNADETCAVCLLNNPDTSIGECLHKFCQGCIDNWKIDKICYRCPLCNHVYDNLDFIANELSTNLRTNNLREALRNIYTVGDTLVNILSAAMRNINTTMVFTANDLIAAIRNINTTTENIVNNLAEAIRNINTTSNYTVNDLAQAMRTNDLIEAIRTINTTTDNLDGIYRVLLINKLFDAIRNTNRTSAFTANDIREAIRNINQTRDNIVNMLFESIRNINQTTDDIDRNPRVVSVFGFPRVVPNNYRIPRVVSKYLTKEPSIVN